MKRKRRNQQDSPIRSSNRFERPFTTILILEQTLSRRVRERHSPIVNKRDVSHSPTHECSRNSTSQSSCSKKQTFGRCQQLGVQVRPQPPPHQPNIQIDGLLHDHLRVHHRTCIEDVWSRLSSFVWLPPQDFRKSGFFKHKSVRFNSFSLPLFGNAPQGNRMFNTGDNSTVEEKQSRKERK